MVGCHAEGGTSGCGNAGRHTDTAERLDRGTRPDTETWPDIGAHLDMGAHLDTGVHPDTRTHPLSTAPIPSPPHGTPCAPQPLTQTCYFPAPAKKKGKATKSPISTHPPQEGLLMSPPHPPFLIRPRQEMGGSAPHAAPLSLPHHAAPPKLRTANAPHKPPQCPTVVGGTATSGAHPGVPDVPTLRTPRLQGAGNHMSPEMRKCFDFVFTLLGGAHPIHPSPEHF